MTLGIICMQVMPSVSSLATNPATNPTDSRQCALTKLEACIANIRQWMPLNGLKLNDGKTEYRCLHSKYLQTPSPLPITFGNDTVSPSTQMKNLSVIFDDMLSCPHIAAICKSAFSSYIRLAAYIGSLLQLLPKHWSIHSFSNG